MKISEIATMPTEIDGIHESVFRSYHTLRKVIELLEAGTPGKVVLEIFDLINEADEKGGKRVTAPGDLATN